MTPTPQLSAVDRTFRALADPTRRGVVEALGRGAASVTELAKPYDMALPSFMQHLRVLEDCGVVRSAKIGRVRTYELVPQAIQGAEGWLAEQRAVWEQRLNQLDDYLRRLKEQHT